MDPIETLIHDNQGNHLVVVLYFYDNDNKTNAFQIPSEFHDIEIADISIHKLNMDMPLGFSAFSGMCKWLKEQMILYPNFIFSYICSLEPLETRHRELTPEKYRWNLFERFFYRKRHELDKMGILYKKIIVGKDEYQTDARVFYRSHHAPIIHIADAYIRDKYRD